MTTKSRTRTKAQNARIIDAQRKHQTLTCRRCGQPVLRGLDADTCASTATIDPEPVDPLTEVVAILTDPDIQTYSVALGEISSRDRTYHAGKATKYKWQSIHLQHKCTNRIPLQMEMELA